ncbi:MAG: M14 family metallopeptidase [Candidatus Aminicenantales bacterium]|jgi:murein tripeptide amidase MpaA
MKNRRIFARMATIVLLVLAFGPNPGGSSDGPAHRPQVLSVQPAPGRIVQLRRLGLDPLGEWEGKIFVLASDAEAAALKAAGIAWVPEADRMPAAIFKPEGTETGLNGAYHSYKKLESDFFALQKQYPELAKVYDLGLSLEKRHVYALKVGANPALEQSKPEVLFLGCHHAREWISVEVPFQLGKYLLENYALDPEIRRLVDAAIIWMVPLVNPDGLEYSIQSYRYWRKNRRDNGGGSFGVDINRNYGYEWGADDVGSSPDPDSDIYRGSAAFSEPETRAVRDFLISRNIQALISYHSFDQTIVYPWGYTTLPAEKDAVMNAIAARMAALIQAVNGRTYSYGESSRDMYVTNGDLTDWAYSLTGIPAYTIELPPADEIDGGFFNAEADIASIFGENLPAMLYLIDWSIQNYKAAAADKDRSGRKKPVRPGRRPDGLRWINPPPGAR